MNDRKPYDIFDDLESLFWVLLLTLLNAQPRKDNLDIDPANYRYVLGMFDDHEISPNALWDSREGILTSSLRVFK